MQEMPKNWILELQRGNPLYLKCRKCNTVRKIKQKPQTLVDIKCCGERPKRITEKEFQISQPVDWKG